MKIKTLKIMFLLLIAPYMFGCDSKQPEQPKPSPKKESPVDLLKVKLNEIKSLRSKLSAKQKDFINKKGYFQGEIDKVKQELLEEQRQERIDNRLANIQEYDAYLQELDRRLQKLHIVLDVLLSRERSFEAKLQMASLMSEVEVNELKNQIFKTIQEYSPEAAELIIDKSKVNLKSKDDILNEIKAEQKKISQEKIEEEKRKKEEEKLLLKKNQEEGKKKNSQIWEEMCGGVFFRISQVTELSAEAAECLSKCKDDTLKLDNLTMLSPEAAQHLSQWIGIHLYLNGLTTLSSKTASYLAQLKHIEHVKCIDRLFSSPDCYYNYDPIHLYLNGLTNLSPETAKYLAPLGYNSDYRKISYIYLNGLNSLSPETAKYLAEWKGYLYLNGLTAIDRETAKYLSQFQGHLYLEKLQNLSEDAAVFLAKRDNDRTVLSDNIKKQLDEIRSRK